MDSTWTFQVASHNPYEDIIQYEVKQINLRKWTSIVGLSRNTLSYWCRSYIEISRGCSLHPFRLRRSLCLNVCDGFRRSSNLRDHVATREKSLLYSNSTRCRQIEQWSDVCLCLVSLDLDSEFVSSTLQRKNSSLSLRTHRYLQTGCDVQVKYQSTNDQLFYDRIDQSSSMVHLRRSRHENRVDTHRTTGTSTRNVRWNLPLSILASVLKMNTFLLSFSFFVVNETTWS